MNNKYENDGVEYYLVPQDGSTWIRIEKDGNFIALCMDQESAFQTIYQDIHNSGGSCGFLTSRDFK